MRKLPLAVLLVWSATAFAQPAPANAPSTLDAAEAITVLRTGLVDSFVKGDIERLLTFLDPDVVVTWQNGEVCRGPDAVRAYYQRMMTGANRVVREVKAAPEVIGRHIYGDWAVSWGNLHDHFMLTDGSELAFNTVFTATIAKRGDRWLVRGFHASVNAFDNAVLKLAITRTAWRIGLLGAILGLALGYLLARRLTAKPAPAS